MNEAASTFRERTLASRYQPRQELPRDFPSVLKEYAREVLRAQPVDILEWSAEYFKRLALETDPLQRRQPPPGHYAPVVEDQGRELLAQRMAKVFASMDAAQEGVLYTNLVRRALMEGFRLTPAQALYIMTSDYVTVLEDDTIDYDTFSRDCVRAVQYFQQTGQEFAVGDLRDATVHGLNQNDVEQGFLRIFRLLDEGSTGRLPFTDYRNALMNAPFHLTHRDIKILCLECDHANSNDEVEYEKEIPRLFDRLVLAEQFELFDTEEEVDEEALQ